MAGGTWMPSISLPHVGSLASGFGQATGFDSPVGQPRGLQLLRLKQGARLPSALEFVADSLSRPLLMAPPLTLAGTFPGAAAPRDGSGTSRTVSAAAADAVAAAAALAPDRRDLSSMVRRLHTCARAACSHGRLRVLWLPLPPPRAASL